MRLIPKTSETTTPYKKTPITTITYNTLYITYNPIHRSTHNINLSAPYNTPTNTSPIETTIRINY